MDQGDIIRALPDLSDSNNYDTFKTFAIFDREDLISCATATSLNEALKSLGLSDEDSVLVKDYAGFIVLNNLHRPKRVRCAWCGKRFVKSDQRRRYCSTQCRLDRVNGYNNTRRKKNRRRIDKYCYWCGKRFEISPESKKYCSKECRAKRNSAYRNAWKRMNRRKEFST